MEQNATGDPPDRRVVQPSRQQRVAVPQRNNNPQQHIRNPPPRPGAVSISRHMLASCQGRTTTPTFQLPVRYVSQSSRPSGPSQNAVRHPQQQHHNTTLGRSTRGGYANGQRLRPPQASANRPQLPGMNQAGRGAAVRKGEPQPPPNQRRQVDHSDPRLSAVPIGRAAAAPPWIGQVPIRRVGTGSLHQEDEEEEIFDEEEEDPILAAHHHISQSEEHTLPVRRPAPYSTLSTSNEDIFKQLEDLRLQPSAMETDAPDEEPHLEVAVEVVLESTTQPQPIVKPAVPEEPFFPHSTIDLIISEVARPRPPPQAQVTPTAPIPPTAKPVVFKEPKLEPSAEVINHGPPPLPKSIAQKKKSGRPKGPSTLAKEEKPAKPRKVSKKVKNSETVVKVEKMEPMTEEEANQWKRIIEDNSLANSNLQKVELNESVGALETERQRKEESGEAKEDIKYQKMIVKLEQEGAGGEAEARTLNEPATRRRKMPDQVKMEEDEDEGEQETKRFKMETDMDELQEELTIEKIEEEITVNADASAHNVEQSSVKIANALSSVSQLSCLHWGEEQWEAVSSILENSFATKKREIKYSAGLGGAVNASFVHEVPETPMKTVDKIGSYFERTFDKITVTFYPQQIFYGELELDITNASTISFIIDSARPRVELRVSESLSDSFSMTFVNKFTMVPSLVRGFPPCFILSSYGLDSLILNMSEKFRKYKEATATPGLAPYQCHPSPLFFVLNSNPQHSTSQCTVEIETEGENKSYRISAGAGFEVMDCHVQLNLAIHPKLTKTQFLFNFLLDNQFWDYILHLRFIWIFLVSRNGRGRWIAKCREDLEMVCDSNFVEMHVETGCAFSLYPPTHRFRPLQRESNGSLDEGFECREPFPLKFRQPQKQRRQIEAFEAAQLAEEVEEEEEDEEEEEKEKEEEEEPMNVDLETDPSPVRPTPSLTNGKSRPHNTSYGHSQSSRSQRRNAIDLLQDLPDPTTLGYDGSGPSTSGGSIYYPSPSSSSSSYPSRYEVSTLGYDGSLPSTSSAPPPPPRHNRLIYRIPKPFPPLNLSEPRIPPLAINGKRVQPEPSTGYFYNSKPAEAPPAEKRARQENGCMLNGNGHAGPSSSNRYLGNGSQNGEASDDNSDSHSHGNFSNGSK